MSWTTWRGGSREYSDLPRRQWIFHFRHGDGPSQKIYFSVDMDLGTVMVNDSTVVVADMLAFNGVTNGIDKVLTVPDSSMAPTMAPSSMSGGALAVGAFLSALFAAVFAVALLIICREID